MGTDEAASLSLDISLGFRQGKRGCNGNYHLVLHQSCSLRLLGDNLMGLTTSEHTIAYDPRSNMRSVTIASVEGLDMRGQREGDMGHPPSPLFHFKRTLGDDCRFLTDRLLMIDLGKGPRSSRVPQDKGLFTPCTHIRPKFGAWVLVPSSPGLGTINR